jgi:hypothetical protein
MKPALLLTLALLCGCQAPLAQLTFPYRPLRASAEPQWFDVDDNGRNEFAVTFDNDAVDALNYDDDEDGKPDRVYRLRDYADADVPHVMIFLDSVPFRCVAERYAAGEFRWFGSPAKVIAPFPSLTEVCYTELLHAAPMPGMIDRFYDRRRGKLRNFLWARAVEGYQHPWERHFHYRLHFREEGLAYLDPRPWYQAELERARRAVNANPERTSLVYLTSASGMACKYGQAGIDEVLDGAARLCLQLLYERRGAVRITLMADHGHNLVSSQNIHIDKLLSSAGFRIAKRLEGEDDVVPELSGLVTYAGVRTLKSAAVADALLRHPGVDMAMYLQGDSVIVRSDNASAAIESDAGRLRYRPLIGDVLHYAKLTLPADGLATRDEWFAATVDHEYPDAAPRLWDAFHRLVADPPEVMFTTHNGYTAGLASFERYITMKSTHGSFDQINSATFVMTMHAPPLQPMRIGDVMKAIAPAYTARVVKR